MKRFSAAVVVFSMFCIGGIGFGHAEDSSCPPGAKFCPAPGLSGNSADVNGAFGTVPSGNGPDVAYDFEPTPAQAAYFEGQLNDGERLIMVAPNAMIDGMSLAPSSPAYGAEAEFGAASSFGGSYGDALYPSDPPGGMYAQPADSYSEPMYADNGTYSAEPAYPAETYSSGFNDNYSVAADSFASAQSSVMPETEDFSSAFDAGFARQDQFQPDEFQANEVAQSGFPASASASMPGYIPPPPGSASMGGSASAADEFDREAMGRMMAGTSARTLFEEAEDDFDTAMPIQRDTGRNYRAKKNSGSVAAAITPQVEDSPMPSMPKPRGYVREEIASAHGFDEGDDEYEIAAPVVSAGRKKHLDATPSREDMAKVRETRDDRDMMSEVANETSRKKRSTRASRAYGDDYEAPSSRASHRVGAPENDRVPWWKGGAWRNRRARQIEKESARAEARAKKERQKASEKGRSSSDRDRASSGGKRDSGKRW